MDIAKAIKAINPSAEFKYSNDDFSTLEWLNGTTPISQADIETKQTELQTEYAEAKTAALAKKASGKQKLKDLGLDDEEIKELTGA